MCWSGSRLSVFRAPEDGCALHRVPVRRLAGAAEVLADARTTWRSTLMAVFQPGEETAQGAKATIGAKNAGFGGAETGAGKDGETTMSCGDL
jgi:hypothetical protein